VENKDMGRIPFSVYDFFGYLLPGFLLVVVMDYALVGHIAGERWVLRDDLGVVYGLTWTVIAYIVGHVLASPSEWLLQEVMVRKWLRSPNINLFSDPHIKEWKFRFFSSYYKPLPPPIRNRILEKAKAEGINETGEALFYHAWGKVKKDQEVMARLYIFLYLYGFSRNVSFACMLACLVMVAGTFVEGSWSNLTWAFVSLFAAIGMLYRYLKFYRHYSVDMFIAYDELPLHGGAR
jgi:hypothetical protein